MSIDGKALRLAYESDPEIINADFSYNCAVGLRSEKVPFLVLEKAMLGFYSRIVKVFRYSLNSADRRKFRFGIVWTLEKYKNQPHIQFTVSLPNWAKIIFEADWQEIMRDV